MKRKQAPSATSKAARPPPKKRPTVPGIDKANAAMHKKNPFPDTTQTTLAFVKPGEKPKVKGFRMNCTKVFLTFPQCEIEKTEAERRLKEGPFKDNIEWYLIGRELHKDGHHHLHIGLGFKKKVNIRQPEYFDFIGGKHGDYQSMKSMKGTIKYVTKEDKEPVAFGVVWEDYVGEKTKGILNSIASMVDAGKTIYDIKAEYPGAVLVNQRKIKEYIDLCKQEKIVNDARKKFLGIRTESLEGGLLTIADWINKNFMEDRVFKQRQLWICGPKNIGKTSLVIKLMEYYRMYAIPKEDFYDFYQDDEVDFASIDEFAGQKTVQFWNEWLQGSIMVLRIKGAQRLKTKNLPSIILSNKTPRECYINVDQRNTELLETLLVRLEVVVLGEEEKLWNLEFIEDEVVEPEVVYFTTDSPEVAVDMLCREEMETSPVAEETSELTVETSEGPNCIGKGKEVIPDAFKYGEVEREVVVLSSGTANAEYYVASKDYRPTVEERREAERFDKAMMNNWNRQQLMINGTEEVEEKDKEEVLIPPIEWTKEKKYALMVEDTYDGVDKRSCREWILDRPEVFNRCWSKYKGLCRVYLESMGHLLGEDALRDLAMIQCIEHLYFNSQVKMEKYLVDLFKHDAIEAFICLFKVPNVKD